MMQLVFSAPPPCQRAEAVTACPRYRGVI